MHYHSYTNYQYGETSVIGVLITNLGTLDVSTKQALKSYLKEFLSDPRVVESPLARWLWRLNLNGIILNTRSAMSAAAYKTVWSSEGSGVPLLNIVKRQITRSK